MIDLDEPLGPKEVATFLDVKRPTVQQWLFRQVLPERDFTVSGFPAWKKTTIVRWAVQTRRMKATDKNAKAVLSADELAELVANLREDEPKEVAG